MCEEIKMTELNRSTKEGALAHTIKTLKELLHPPTSFTLKYEFPPDIEAMDRVLELVEILIKEIDCLPRSTLGYFDSTLRYMAEGVTVWMKEERPDVLYGLLQENKIIKPDLI